MVKLKAQTTALAIAAAAIAGSLSAGQASAAVVLAFGQAGQGSPFSGTANGTTSTTLSAKNVNVIITELLGSSAPVQAFFNLSANSTDAASLNSDGDARQLFSGTLSITSGAGGTGINYLSAAFSALEAGLGSSSNLRASTPQRSVVFTSSVLSPNDLGLPRALSLAFSNVTGPQGGAAVCGSTLCSFNSSVSGNFSASAVPEPASWAMMVAGFGLLGATMRRRRATTSVRFA